MPFEGIEKKVEVLLREGAPSLRALGREFWNGIVRRSDAEIIRLVSSRSLDAYLLSESSLFVSDRRMIMITCGRTRLISGVAALLESVSADDLDSLIYERKNENFPHLQPTTFLNDVSELRDILPGSAQTFGDPAGHHLSLFHLDRRITPAGDDQTLELLMYDLDPEVRKQFHTGPDRTAQSVRRAIDLDAVLPGFTWDDHLFEPAGYSLNGVRDDRYATIHVTPDNPGSYASFEAGCPLAEGELEDLCAHLLAVFRPARYDVVLFRDRPPATLPPRLGRPGTLEDRKLSCGYRVHFHHYETGLAPEPAPERSPS